MEVAVKKTDFIAELRRRLSNLPPDEVDRTVSYFSEIIDDRIEDGIDEQEAVSSLEKIDDIVNALIPLQKETGKTHPNSFQAADVRSVRLKDINSPIHLVCSDSEYVTLDYYENNCKTYQIALSPEGELTITCELLKKWFEFFGIGYVCRPFTLGIPKRFTGSLMLDTRNGSIAAAGFELPGNLSLKTSNGKVSAERLHVSEEFTVKTSNGGMFFGDIQTRALHACTSNGKIEAERVSAQKTVSLETNNSGIHVEHLFAGSGIKLVSSNGKISGLIEDNLRAFSVKSHTSNGSSTLPSQMGGGTKDLAVYTSNGRIDLRFLQ
jgi:hypothetical protein